MKNSKNSTSKRLIKNGVFLLVLTFSNYFIGLLLFPYISRVLSIEGFGLIGFAMSYAVIFQVMVEFGFMISATAKISKSREDKKEVSVIVSSAMYAKLMLAVVSLVSFCISALFIPMVRDHFDVVGLFVIGSILAAMLPDFFFRGIEEMKSIAIRTVSIRALFLLLVLFFVRDESQILLIPTAFIIGNALAVVLSFVAMYKKGGRLTRVQASHAIKIIRESSLFFMSRIATSINQSIGAFMIGLKYGPTSVESGIFSGAARISQAGEMMVAPVSDSLYPHMVNKRDYGLFKKVVIYGGLLWFVGCAFMFVFAEDVCQVVLGADYEVAGDYLRILLFGSFMAYFSNLFGYNALTPIGKVNHANIALFVSAIFNIIIYGILWMTDCVNLISVCIVMASTNFIVFGYRGFVLWRNRDLIKAHRRD